MEVEKEKLKIDFSTIVIVIVLILLIIGGGTYHLINRINKKNSIQYNTTNSVEENEENNSINDYQEDETILIMNEYKSIRAPFLGNNNYYNYYFLKGGFSFA